MMVFAVRTWSADDDPRLPVLLERLRSRGVEVHDLYVPSDRSTDRTYTEWARRVADDLEALRPEDEPLRLLGYCMGGGVAAAAADELSRRGNPPDFLGLIDMAIFYSAVDHIEKGWYRRYRVGHRQRLRLVTKDLRHRQGPSMARLGRALVLGAAKRTGAFFVKGPMVLRRRHFRNYHSMHLSLSAHRPSVPVPVHLYTSEASAREYRGDYSLHWSELFIAGYAVRVVPGEHLSCLEDPNIDHLVDAVVHDLHTPADLFARFCPDSPGR